MTSITKEPVVTLSAGPVAAYPRVLRGLSRPVQYDFDGYFQEFYERVTRKVAQALRCEQPALILHCEPAPGIEAAAASLIGPDDVVLNLASGVYGKGFGYWSARYHKEMIEIEVPYNEAIDPQQVRDAFRRRPDIKVVSVVHHDTPSGTLNPINEIGRIVREHDALLLVDAVSSFAGMDVHPGDCAADIFITGPGKCLGGPPGLTIVAVSDRAWKHIEANPKAPRASILSFLDWKEAWRKDRPFPFTPSVSEVNGLDAAIDQYLDEGAEQVWRRHALTARACRAGIKAMGLALWPAREEIASPTTTAVRVPDGGAARLWRGVLERPWRDAGQAVAHRPHGPGGGADLCGDRRVGARRCAATSRQGRERRRRRRGDHGRHRRSDELSADRAGRERRPGLHR
jgi:pyridoxamine--pyruvate transaminase